MSITTKIKHEHKKLSEDIHHKQRQLKALEALMKEYKIWVYPSTKNLSSLLEECVIANKGAADFDTIIECLENHGVETEHQKISVTLSKHPRLHYDRAAGQWKAATIAKAS